MATDFQRLIETLVDGHVEFVIIGGVAVIAHGHTRLTEDLDVCYRRSEENFERLSSAVAPLRPTLRGAPADLPFVLDARTLRSGLNFTLETTAGDLDGARSRSPVVSRAMAGVVVRRIAAKR